MSLDIMNMPLVLAFFLLFFIHIFQVSFSMKSESDTFLNYYKTIMENKIPIAEPPKIDDALITEFLNENRHPLLHNLGTYTWPYSSWMDKAFKNKLKEQHQCTKGLEIAAGMGVISNLIAEAYGFEMTITDALEENNKQFYKLIDSEEDYLEKVRELTSTEAVKEYSEDNDFLLACYLPPGNEDIISALEYWSEKDVENKKPIVVLGREYQLEGIDKKLKKLGYSASAIEEYRTPLSQINHNKEVATFYCKNKNCDACLTIVNQWLAFVRNKIYL